MKKYLVLILILFLFLLIYGITKKEYKAIYINAKITCLSCIGIGK